MKLKLAQLLSEINVLKMSSPEIAELEITDVTIDTRGAKPGALYAALPTLRAGGKHGIEYIESARDAGCAAVLLDCGSERCEELGIPYILTDDAGRATAFASAALYGNPEKSLQIIGVTGTKGKTSTTHYIRSALSSLGYSCGLIGTNHIIYADKVIPAKNTTPAAPEFFGYLADMRDAGVTHVVCEISSHSLAVGRVAPVEFAVGMFLNLSQDHLDYHKTMDAYADAKGKLAEMSRVFIANADDKRAGEMLARAAGKKLTFALESRDADIQAKNPRYLPDRVTFEALCEAGIRRVNVNTPGLFSIYNGLAAVSALLALGIGLDDAAAAVSDAPPVEGRAEVVPNDRDFTVMVDYAHTPESIEEILLSMRRFTEGRLIIVFGCGGNRDALKRPIMGEIAANLADAVIITTDNPRFEEPEAIIAEIMKGAERSKRPITNDPALFAKQNKASKLDKVMKKVYVTTEPDRAEAVKKAINAAQPGDTVIIAGKGHENYQEIKGVKYPMDDKELIKAAFRE